MKSALILVALSLTAIAQTETPPRTFRLLTPTLGWVWTADGRLLISTDARSLHEIAPPKDPDRTIEAVTFVPDGSGWVLLRGAEGGLSLQITKNGGTTWEEVQIPLDQATLDSFAGANLSFGDNRNGWLIVSWLTTTVPFGQMWHTVDGGMTWAKLPRPPTYGPIRFDSATHGILIGGATRDLLWGTSDSGKSWSPNGRAPEGLLTGLNFDQAKVLSLPSDALARLTLGSSRNIATRVSFADPMHGWVEIHNTSDQQTSWALANTEDGGSTYQILLRGTQTRHAR